MSNSVELYKRINEIAGCYNRGMTTGEIKKTYMPRWCVSERTIDRYVELAKDQFMEGMEQTDELIEAMRAKIIAESVEHLLSNLELQTLLCSFAKGEQVRERKVKTEKGEKTVQYIPTFHDSIRAINSLVKIRSVRKTGANESTKVGNPLHLNGNTKEEQEFLENT